MPVSLLLDADVECAVGLFAGAPGGRGGPATHPSAKIPAGQNEMRTPALPGQKGALGDAEKFFPD
ncbi:MAG: hypothetical protein C0617_12995 [Desulfuromonas sp.]|nr:MAG: hypothetical protein C0617_12995 [Desulfuromonas sp.]